MIEFRRAFQPAETFYVFNSFRKLLLFPQKHQYYLKSRKSSF